MAHISKRSARARVCVCAGYKSQGDRDGEEREREGEVYSNPTKYILIVEFSVRVAYPLEPLCPLPATDLLIINYPDNELSHPPFLLLPRFEGFVFFFFLSVLFFPLFNFHPVRPPGFSWKTNVLSPSTRQGGAR